MSDHQPSRRILRQRERKAAKATERAATAAYNRAGLDACCKALGAGESSDWPQEDGADE